VRDEEVDVALGRAVVVPFVNPASAAPLIRLAALVAIPDEGRVTPLMVVGPDTGDDERERARAIVIDAEEAAREHGADAQGLVVTDAAVADGVLAATKDRAATLVVMGWQGRSSTHNVFGRLIDSLVGRSSIPLGIVRWQPDGIRRIVLPITNDHLQPAGARGLRLAADLVERVHAGTKAPVVVVRSGTDAADVPEQIGQLADRVHHDARAVDLAVGAAARPGDLIIPPVAPTASGLRSATTHLAWAAPESSLLVAVDVGPPPGDSIAAAVGGAGKPPPRRTDDGGPDETYLVTVTAHLATHVPADAAVLVAPLRLVGPVESSDAWIDDDAQACVRAQVRVTAPSPTVAIGAAMSAIDEATALDGAEISYDLN
jgi:hypothetical protein